MAEGSPRLVRAAVPLAATERHARILLDGALKDALGAEVPARLHRRGGETEVRARLGRAAPPGRHEVTLLTAGGEKATVVVDVPERRRVRVSPAELDVSGPLGGSVEHGVVFSNRGNVPVEIPGSAIAGAFASDGVASAFSRAYAAETDDPQEVFGAFVLGLRGSHLGLMRLSLKGADGPIAPGASVEATARITLPKPARGAATPGPGRRYHATFALGDVRITVRFVVERGEESPR